MKTKFFAMALSQKPGQMAPQRIFAAAKKDTTLELLVYDSIGASYWGDGVTAKRVKAQLDAAGDVTKIVLRINSPGGDVFEGSAIYSLLTQHKAEVETYVDGLAASAAFTIAMAGKKIHVSEAGMMMCHNAWGMCMGDSKEMRATAEILDKVSGTMRDIYCAKTGKSAEDMQKLMDAESWFTAQECVDNGFANDVVKREPDEDEQAKALAASFDLSKFAHAPDSLKKAAPSQPVDQLKHDQIVIQAPENFRMTAQARDNLLKAWRDAQDQDKPIVLEAGWKIYTIEPKAEAKTKSVDGEDLTKDCFAYRPDDKLENWKLPIKFSTEEKTKTHIQNAISRWSSTDMPDADEKSKARERIKTAAKKYDIDVDEDSLKDSVEANDNCMCDCPECQAGNCADCSDPDCDDPNCEGGDNDADDMKTRNEMELTSAAFEWGAPTA